MYAAGTGGYIYLEAVDFKKPTSVFLKYLTVQSNGGGVCDYPTEASAKPNIMGGSGGRLFLNKMSTLEYQIMTVEAFGGIAIPMLSRGPIKAV